MQEQLGYRVRKTLAKYLDEFNWYEMVGAGRVARGGDNQPHPADRRVQEAKGGPTEEER